jgi:hypothetical protein
MADSFTAKLNLTKPEVGASTDTWGTKVNGDLDTIDGLFETGPYLKIANGGTAAGTAANARTNLGLAIGTNVQAYDADLAAIAGITTTGIVARTGSGTAEARVLTAGSGIGITNGDGASGNPTIAASGLATTNFASATLVTASETIASNNNDTTIPTSAAVKGYADGSITATATGSANLPGGLQMRWGTGSSTGDDVQSFTFSTAFSNNCFVVIVQPTQGNQKFILPPNSKSTTGFSIDRDSDLSGTQPFTYFAIGN